MKLCSLFGFDVLADASWILLVALVGWTLGGAVFPATLHGQTPATYWAMSAAAAARGGVAAADRQRTDEA